MAQVRHVGLDAIEMIGPFEQTQLRIAYAAEDLRSAGREVMTSGAAGKEVMTSGGAG